MNGLCPDAWHGCRGTVDKREGSIIYDAIAPAAAELAILYSTLSTEMDRLSPIPQPMWT